MRSRGHTERKRGCHYEECPELQTHDPTHWGAATLPAQGKRKAPVPIGG